MKIGLYAGVFNPLHEGHMDIINKASVVFDKLYVVFMNNPSKTNFLIKELPKSEKNIMYRYGRDTLKETIEVYKPDCMVRGLRGGKDIDYEMDNQDWNEDVGINTPFVYFISHRTLRHVSSSSIKSVKQLGLGSYYEIS